MSKDILTRASGDKLKNFSKSWKKLSTSQKISVFFLMFLLLSLPLAVLVSMQPVRLFSRADYPITPPYTPSPTFTATPSSTSTPRVTPQPATPTPKVTIVPTPVVNTPTPTATPVPSWTAIPNETPTPPSYNNSPVITTKSLRNARVGSRYRYYVRAYDVDSNENMRMYIDNLPSGLMQGDCRIGKTISGGTSISCPIIGSPQEAGNVRVDVTVFDTRGGYDQVLYGLKVRDRINWKFWER